MIGIRCETRRLGDVIIAELDGEIDFANSNEVGHVIDEALIPPVSRLIVDATRLRYLDSAGVLLLFKLARRLEAQGGELLIVLPSMSPLKKLIDITNVDAVARVVSSVAAALSPRDARPVQGPMGPTGVGKGPKSQR